MADIVKNHSNLRAKNWLMYTTYERFLEKYIPFYNGVLLDFGCGEAPYKDFFLQHVEKYIGIDWTNSSHPTEIDIVADLNRALPIKPNTAETIVSFSVLEHLCEPQTMLDEAFRIMRHGGAIILQVPWQWRIHESPYDYFRYSPYGLKYMFEKAGFVDIIVEPQSGFFTMRLMKWNYFSSRFARKIESKYLRWIVKGLLAVQWYLGQRVSPYLDKLDTDWVAESSGYWVVARKKKQ